MIEVEIRTKISNILPIKRRLKKLKIRYLKSFHQIDRIFGHKKFLNEKNIIVDGGIVARIRTVNNRSFLEFKEIRRKSGAFEITSELADVNFGITLLKKLGYKEAFSVDKKRITYKYKSFNIDIDSVKKLGNFIEIERNIKSKKRVYQVRKECIDLLSKICPNYKIENKKYGDLLQEQINKRSKKLESRS